VTDNIKFALDTQFICKEKIFDDLGRVKIHTRCPQEIACEILALNASFIEKYNLWNDNFLGKNWTHAQNLTAMIINRFVFQKN